MADVAFIPNPAGVENLFSSPASPWGISLARRAIRVESQAKVNASGRPGPNVQTGRLRSSIHWEFAVIEGDLAAIIGSNVEYAGYVELGTDRAPPYPYLRPSLRAAL